MFSCEALTVFNRFIVRIGVPRSSSVVSLKVTRSDGVPLFAFPMALPSGSGALASAGRSFSKQNAVHTFLSELSEPGVLTSMVRSPVTVEAVIDGEAQRWSIMANGIGDMESLGAQVLKRLEADEEIGPLAPPLAAGKVVRVENHPFHVDYAYAENGCLLINGWMANFASLDVYVLVNGYAFAASSKSAIVHSRPDVVDYIRGMGFTDVSGTGHGYSMVVDCLDPTVPFSIGYLQNGIFHIVAQPQPSLSQDRGRVFQLLLGARQGTSFTPLEKITRNLTPYLRSNTRSLAYDVILASRFGPSSPPRLSIIVPFYKEWRFLYSQLSMIKSAPRDFEWVIVCDDATIFPQMNLQISNQLPEVRDRITFVLPRQNVGYGHANNIGVEVAKGSRVLLMNSDIWLRSFDVLDFGLKALDSGDYGLIGFTLLFEDNTIQHDGLSFRRSMEVGDRYLALHPGKGLPPRATTERYDLETAYAVTGALMLMDRDRFNDIGGFSDRYIGGDFEDADLCLVLGQTGHKVGLVRSTEIYHLERQSIRLDSANSVGFARTLVNCVRFNERWRGTLETRSTQLRSTV